MIEAMEMLRMMLVVRTTTMINVMVISEEKVIMLT